MFMLHVSAAHLFLLYRYNRNCLSILLLMRIWPIINKANMNMLVGLSVNIGIRFPWVNKYLEVELVGDGAGVCFTL